jgi:hypothetical protein
MTSIEKLIQVLTEGKTDLEKGYAGNKAACTRGRKVMQEITSLAKEVRQELMAVKKGEMAESEITLSDAPAES